MERERERKSEARTFSSLITSKSIFYPKEGETRHGFSTRENLQSSLKKMSEKEEGEKERKREK